MKIPWTAWFASILGGIAVWCIAHWLGAPIAVALVWADACLRREAAR